MRLPTLYKRAKNGKISMWVIYTNNGTIFILHGYIDGATQLDTIEALPKNVGRSNETSAEAQAELEAQSRWQKQVDQKGYTINHDGIADIRVYLPMLAQKYAERGRHIDFPCFVQPKLNGMRCISYIKDGKRVYQSRLGKFWTTLDHLDKDLESFKDVILDGEIYLHGTSLQDIASLVKNQHDNTVNGIQVKDLEYWVYDIISNDHQAERIRQIESFFTNGVRVGTHVFRLSTSLCLTKEDLTVFHKINLIDGYEGTIIRNKLGRYSLNERSNDLQKHKPILDGEFTIVGGYMVATGREEGTCIFTCETISGTQFDVRPKGSLQKRKNYWNNLKSLVGKKLTCKFQEWTADGKPFHARGVAIRDYE